MWRFQADKSRWETQRLQIWVLAGAWTYSREEGSVFHRTYEHDWGEGWEHPDPQDTECNPGEDKCFLHASVGEASKQPDGSWDGQDRLSWGKPVNGINDLYAWSKPRSQAMFLGRVPSLSHCDRFHGLREFPRNAKTSDCRSKTIKRPPQAGTLTVIPSYLFFTERQNSLPSVYCTQ